MTDQADEEPAEPSDDMPGRYSRRTRLAMGVGCLAGVLFVILVTILLAILLRAHGVAGSFLRGNVDQIIENSPLAGDEKADAGATVEKFLNLAGEEKIPREKVQLFLWRFAQGKIGRMFTLHKILNAVDNSTLNENLKAEARRNVDRMAAALAEDELTDDEYGQMKNAMPAESDGSPKPPPWSDVAIKTLTDRIGQLAPPGDAGAGTLQTFYMREVRGVISSMKQEIQAAEKGMEHLLNGP